MHARHTHQLLACAVIATALSTFPPVAPNVSGPMWVAKDV